MAFALPAFAVTAEVAKHNRVLAALTPTKLNQLLPSVEPIRAEIKTVFYEWNRPITHVYFILSGVGSMLALAEDGGTIEVATVGNEGMVGLPAFLGAETAPFHTIMQVPGDALRLGVEAFRNHIRDDPEMTLVLHRYTQALISQIAQNSACNRLHSSEERCARWLLLTHDRTGTDQFPLTHEFLAQMLGVRRATVTEVAGALQAAGVIEYSRGIVRVVNRKGLEDTSCECYGIVKAEFDRLLGLSTALSDRNQAKAAD
jgi:CRP-like cAMP-binding protein